MSIYSTLRITRSKARQVVLEHIYGHRLGDELLEKVLDEILENRFYNAIVVEDSDENDDNAL